jgi:hypothetical protein
MPISFLSSDSWRGNMDNGETIPNPTWEQVEATIRGLDGEKQTLVTLNADENCYIMIGGGQKGKYVVITTHDNVVFYNLTAQPEQKGQVVLVVGGQGGEYPAKMCVGLEEATKAARSFFENGSLDTSLLWEVDN